MKESCDKPSPRALSLSNVSLSSINSYVIVNRNISYNSRDSVAMTQNGTNPAARRRRSGLFAHARESFSLSGILTLKRRADALSAIGGASFANSPPGTALARIHPARVISTRDLCRADGMGVRA